MGNTEIKEKREHKYDYNLKNKNERADYIDDRLGHILNLPSHMLMGYSGEDRKDNKKYNRIPKLMDGYTAYFLESRDTESTKKTEYSFYLDKHDELLRKKNQVLYHQSKGFDGDENDDNAVNYGEVYKDEEKSYIGCPDYSFENADITKLKYAFNNGLLSLEDYKKILSMSADIFVKSNDEDLKEMIEQVVFNCAVNCQDGMDTSILNSFIKGETLRGIADEVKVSYVTVKRKIDKIMSWV